MENKQKEKVKKALKKIFNLDENEVKLAKEKLLSNNYTILGVALNDEAKEIFSYFIGSDNINTNNLEFFTSLEVRSKYNINYLYNIINVLRLCDDDEVIIKMKDDYPIMLENKYFRFILAPRVDMG